MKDIKRILVCLDPDNDKQPALQKALYLATVYGAELILFLVAYNRGLVSNLFFNADQIDAAKQGYINSQKRWLESYVEDVEAAGVQCSTQVKWHKPLYEAIINQAVSSEADLVIKSTHKHPTINKVFFTPNDWQLLKSCPVPLILAKAETGNEYRRILAAIDPKHSHDKPEALDPLIVASAKELGNKLDGDCHVVHCYEPIGYQLWTDIGVGMGIGMGPTDFTMGEENYEDYVSELKKSQEKEFNKIVKPFNFAEDHLHLVEGYPESTLPEMVKNDDYDLLAIGTVYHSGLIGSTAEKILDNLECDILSVHVAKS